MRRIGRFGYDEEGVSGAVSATLVVAIITLVFSAIYAVAVPVWVENAEAAHMQEVSNEFKSMKKNIDAQVDMGDKPFTVSSKVSLKPEPTTNFFGMEGTTQKGELSVDPYSEIFNISNTDNPGEVLGTCQGAIYFQSKNNYYERQTYIYSNSAVLRVQENTAEKGVITAPPRMDLVDEAGNRTLYFSTITLFGEQTTLSGSNSVNVQTNAIEAMAATYEGGVWDSGVNITINSISTLGYAKIYEHQYDEMLSDLGYTKGVEYNLTRTSDHVRLDIKDINKVVLYTGTIQVELK